MDYENASQNAQLQKIYKVLVLFFFLSALWISTQVAMGVIGYQIVLRESTSAREDMNHWLSIYADIAKNATLDINEISVVFSYLQRCVSASGYCKSHQSFCEQM
jgi:hypothetical protein